MNSLPYRLFLRVKFEGNALSREYQPPKKKLAAPLVVAE